MAITATIALSSATVKAEQKTTATVTVSNSGAATVYVTNVSPLVTPHSGTKGSVAVAVGGVPLGGAFTSSVAASGSSNFSFDLVPHAPNTSYGIGAEASQYVYDIGAVVSTSDGSLTSPTVTTLTVNYPAN